MDRQMRIDYYELKIMNSYLNEVRMRGGEREGERERGESGGGLRQEGKKTGTILRIVYNFSLVVRK